MDRHDQLIAQSRQTLAALRSTTAHAQQLIDELTLTLDSLTEPALEPVGSAVPDGASDTATVNPAPVHAAAAAVPAPPAPTQQPVAAQPRASLPGHPSPPPSMRDPVVPSPGPRWTTEQKVIRAAAVLGSLITFVGACFGVALAIQTGLLGPAGRAIGAFVFALVLLGAGCVVDIRRGSSPGATALYVTSFLVVLADLVYVGPVKEWMGAPGIAGLFILAWVVYLVVAGWRRNLWLVACMCVSAFPHHIVLWPDTAATCVITMAAPLLAIACTWFVKRRLPDAMPRLTLGVRLAASALLAWQLAFAGIVSALVITNLLPAVAVGYAGVFMLLAGERFFPTADLGRTAAVLASVVAPATIILASLALLEDAALWLPPVVSVAATVAAAHLWRTEPRNTDCLTGWLIFTPFTFLPIAFDVHAQVLRDPVAEAVPVLIFLAAFAAVLVALRFTRANRVAVLSAWTLALFSATLPLQFGALDSSLIRPAAVFGLAQGAALLAVLIFAVTRVAVWRPMPAPMIGLFAGAALMLGMVGVVTVCTSLGGLIAPGPNPRYVASPGAEAGFFTGHMIVSIAWMALASWLLLSRPSRSAGGNSAVDDKTARIAGLVIAVVATGKLVFFDMASLSGVPRVITFVVCGLLLIAVSVLGAQRKHPEGTGRSGPAGEPHPVAPATEQHPDVQADANRLS